MYSIVYIYYIFIIHSLVKEYVDCFLLVVIVTMAAIIIADKNFCGVRCQVLWEYATK